MNSITVDGNYKFEIDAFVWYKKTEWQVKHRYTERFSRNAKSAIARYVIWHVETNALRTVSEVALQKA
jgi:hypothetical protein